MTPALLPSCGWAARLLLITSLLLLLSGCAPLLGLQVYEHVERRKAQAAGTMPPDAILRQCSQESTVRAADGSWRYDQAIYQTCYDRWRP